ncbi:hypothetical protein OURE66S_03820 [Oligella ureolytica]|nr:type II toxin-antitoxin system RelE/ParE family toxin [Oligella sp.]
MMELFWTLEAIQDREDIYDFIEEDSPLAALSVDELISEKTALLKNYPNMGRAGKIHGTFELIIHGSYMVVYEIVEMRVRILNVVHTSRNWPML